MMPVGAVGVAEVMLVVEWVAIVFLAATNLFYAALLVLAVREARDVLRRAQLEDRRPWVQSSLCPTVTVLAPAYNEARSIVTSVRNLLALYYPRLEVVVVNDGSTDDTLALLVDAFGLVAVEDDTDPVLDSRPIRATYRSRQHPNLVVIDKENGGKADALNAGLNAADSELVCAVDADTLMEAEALQRLIRPFLTRRDVVATGGTILLANACRIENGRVVEMHPPTGRWTGFQWVEYLRAFLFGRMGLNRAGGNIVISGAFGLFDRAAVLDAGGYRTDTVGEDIELVVRLRAKQVRRKAPSAVLMLPDPVAFTEAPSEVRTLARQRDRWHRGLAQTALAHQRLMFSPRYGRMGLVVVPYFFIVELFAPVMELVGLVVSAAGLAAGVLDLWIVTLFFVATYGVGVLLTVLTLFLDDFINGRDRTLRDRLKPLPFVLAEPFGYRQMTVFWRLRGIYKALRGDLAWGKMDRKGFGAKGP